MQITAKQYAAALYETVKDEKESRIKDAIKNFVKVLIDNNDISKQEKIIARFKSIWNRGEGLVEAEIISAREPGKSAVKLLNDYIVKLTGVKKAELALKVDKDILGGAVIRYGDKILDGSLRTRLKELREVMEK